MCVPEASACSSASAAPIASLLVVNESSTSALLLKATMATCWFSLRWAAKARPAATAVARVDNEDGGELADVRRVRGHDRDLLDALAVLAHFDPALVQVPPGREGQHPGAVGEPCAPDLAQLDRLLGSRRGAEG